MVKHREVLKPWSTVEYSKVHYFLITTISILQKEQCKRLKVIYKNNNLDPFVPATNIHVSVMEKNRAS